MGKGRARLGHRGLVVKTGAIEALLTAARGGDGVRRDKLAAYTVC